MPYLLNLIYLLLIVASLPWLVWQSVRKGKYREGYAAKFFGMVPTAATEKLAQDGRTEDSRELTTPGHSGSKIQGQGRGVQKVPGAVSPRLSSAREADAATKPKRLWLHAVSVGEVNLLAPLLKRIAQDRPDWECVISTTTTTGMALAKKKYPEHLVFYCPLDFTWAVKNAMRRIRPDVLVLAELELWPNLIRAAKQSGAKVAVINGRLGEKSFRGYRRIRWMVARLMRQIDLIAAQDEAYAERFRCLGARADAVHVTGSMKYDGAQTDRENRKTCELRALAGFADEDVVLLAGSTQEPEEQMAVEVFADLLPKWPTLRLVLVPRHPDRFNAVASLLDRSGLPWQRRTELKDRKTGVEGREEIAECRMQNAELGTSGRRPVASGQNRAGATESPSLTTQHSPLATTSDPQSTTDDPKSENLPPLASCSPSPRVLLVDVVGELGAWWGTAQIAFVGGSMGSRGGQNMIEPAAYGAAVCFGPNTWNFRDIVAAILSHNAAVVVEDQRQFAAFAQRCLEEPAYVAELGGRAKAFVLSQLGATERTVALLADKLG